MRGSWHHPQTFYDYSEEGLASWYGPRFHNKKKASSERFNQHAMNAAHRTLPLPTIVRVTNLENGRSAVLLVDDRGPYTYTGRIIDLSMGAAKALGFYQKGLARVHVESLVEDSKALSDYLAVHRMSKENLDRTWQEIYEKEIKGRYLGAAGASSAKSRGEGAGEDAEVQLKVAPPKVALPKVELPKLPDQKTVKAESKAAQQNTSPKNSALQNAAPQNAAPQINEDPFVFNLKEVFTKKNSAEKMAQKVRSKFQARVVSEQAANGKNAGKPVWRVQVGPFTDASKTAQIREQIKQLAG